MTIKKKQIYELELENLEGMLHFGRLSKNEQKIIKDKIQKLKRKKGEY